MAEAHKESDSTEAASTGEKDQENDQILYTALKKLKMDTESECTCSVTKEADNQGPLKHKHDVGKALVGETEKGEEAGDGWSNVLQNFCFCDPQPDTPSSKRQSKPLYYCHKHRRQRSRSVPTRNSLNLVHAAGVRKPVLREAKLKFPVDERSRQVLRASRLKVTTKTNMNRDLAPSLSDTKTALIHTTAAKSLSASGTVKCGQSGRSAGSDCTRAAFLSTSTDQLTCFSSLSLSSQTKSSLSKEEHGEPVPQFDGYRDNPQSSFAFTPVFSTTVPATDRNQSASSAAPLASQSSPPAAITSAAARLDLSTERSCSQEARLDEMSVNELAAYFDDFIHIPKKMSSMAEMMYT